MGAKPYLVNSVEIRSIRLGEKREREKTEEKRNGGRKGREMEKGKISGVLRVEA